MRSLTQECLGHSFSVANIAALVAIGRGWYGQHGSADGLMVSPAQFHVIGTKLD
jgi:hypothetical protein